MMISFWVFLQAWHKPIWNSSIHSWLSYAVLTKRWFLWYVHSKEQNGGWVYLNIRFCKLMKFFEHFFFSFRIIQLIIFANISSLHYLLILIFSRCSSFNFKASEWLRASMCIGEIQLKFSPKHFLQFLASLLLFGNSNLPNSWKENWGENLIVWNCLLASCSGRLETKLY